MIILLTPSKAVNSYKASYLQKNNTFLIKIEDPKL